MTYLKNLFTNERFYNTAPKLAGVVCMVCPIFIYFYFINSYAVNIPFSADFHALDEMVRIKQANSIREYLHILFLQDDVHRTIFNRIIYTIVYNLFGEFNFRTIIFIGNGALLGLLYFFFKNLHIPQRKLLFFIPIALMLFQLHKNWVHFFFSLSSISHQYVLLFAGFTFYFLNKKSNSFLAAAFCFAAAAAFTQGGGIVTFAVGLLCLIAEKRWKQSIVWLAGSLIIISFHFSSFKFHANESDNIFIALTNVKRVAIFSFSYLGSTLSFDVSTVAFIIGLVFISYFFYLTFKKYYSTNPAIYFFMVFFIFYAVTISLARSGHGLGTVYSDRYRIGPLILFILVYISLIDLIYPVINPKRIIALGMVIFSIATIVYIFSFVEGKQRLEYSKFILTSRLNQWLDQNNGLYHENQSYANASLLNGITAGVYNLPFQFLSIPDGRYSKTVDFPTSCRPNNKMKLSSNFNVIPVGSKAKPFLVRIEGIVYGPSDSQTQEQTPVNLILESPSGARYFVSTHSQKNLNTSVHYKAGFYNAGVLALIPFQDLKDGIYQIGFCHRENVIMSGYFISKHNQRFKASSKVR